MRAIDDDSMTSEEDAKELARRKSSVFAQKRQFRQTFNAQFAATNAFPKMERRGALLKKQSSLSQIDYYNENVGVAHMEKYFGQPARKDFFGRYHRLAQQRRVVDNYNQEVLSKTLFDASPTPSLDFPFAPRRPDLLDSIMFDSTPSQTQFPFSAASDANASPLDAGSSTANTSLTSLPLSQVKNIDIEAPSSPRSKYLQGCLRDNLPPRPSLIIRKNLTRSLHLQHQGIGDRMGKIFAESLQDLPFIHSIDLTDNNLTDAGLAPIIHAVVTMPSLTYLNISQNVIDGEAARALARFLATKHCPLVRLVMQKADIDDSECENFVEALNRNRTLKELDLSSNLIGEAENKNTVLPNIITGGEALGDLLMSGICPLESLHLSWNMLRLDGAVYLSKSLAMNSTLTYLDLSYNSLGKDGGEALGAALLTNRTLRTLNLARNNINGTACLTICVGIEENFSLRSVNLDHNPIGESGAKALMQLPVTSGSRVKISAEHCNVSIKDSVESHRTEFDICSPDGNYSLNLGDPYEYAIAAKLLRIAACHPTFVFSHCSISCESTTKSSSAPRKIPIELVQSFSTEKAEYLDADQKLVIANLRRVEAAASDVEAAMRLFLEYDTDGSGSLDPDELQQLLCDIGLDLDREVIVDAISMYDIDGVGTMDIPEFASFLRSQKDEAVARYRDMTEYPVMCLRGNSKTKYAPPREGTMHISLIDSYSRKSVHKVISSLDHSHVMEVAGDDDSGHTAQKLLYAIQNSKIRLKEALLLFDPMYDDLRDKAKVLSMLLPFMLDATEARNLMHKILDGDKLENARLKQMMGQALNPILGLPNGYYTLDLSREVDRQCLAKLLEQNESFRKQRIEKSLFSPGVTGDVSALGDWSCFRNGFIDGEPVGSLHADRFTPMPKQMKLQFDFSGSDPPPVLCNPISDSRCVGMLLNLGMLHKGQKSMASKTLKRWKEDGLQALYGDGRHRPTVNARRAKTIGRVMYKFYFKLPSRLKQHEKALLKEGVKVDIYAGRETACNSNEQATDALVADDDESVDVSIASSEDTMSDTGGVSDDDVAPELGSTGFSLYAAQQRTQRGNIAYSTSLGKSGSVEYTPRTPRTAKNYSTTGVLSPSQSTRSIMDFAAQLKDLAEAVDIVPAAKAYRTVDALCDLLSRVWLRCRHLALILRYFTAGETNRTPNFGTYRVELVVTLYARVVDIHNFELILHVLTAHEVACVHCRLGILNTFNPMTPEGCYFLDLAWYDQRMVVKMLAALSVVEPGENWINETFRWDISYDDIPGWRLLQAWMVDSGLPQRGYMFIEYCGGRTSNSSNVPFRKCLLHLVCYDVLFYCMKCACRLLRVKMI